MEMKINLSLPFLLLSLIFLSSCVDSTPPKLVQTKDTTVKTTISRKLEKEKGIGGVYSFGKDIEKGPIGSIRIYPLSTDSALFFLNVNRGAPSYNMGLLVGQIKLQDKVWNYSAKDGKSTCVLKFHFSEEVLNLEVISEEDDCGFGFGVHVDHSYKKVSSEIPTYFLNGEGDTVRFEELRANLKKIQ